MMSNIFHSKATCHVCNKVLERERNCYGGQSCDACRAFFRRMVAKKLRSKCKENDICPVPNIYGWTCTSCRLNKCIRSVNQQSKVKSWKLFWWFFPRRGVGGIPSTHSAKIINFLSKITTTQTNPNALKH